MGIFKGIVYGEQQFCGMWTMWHQTSIVLTMQVGVLTFCYCTRAYPVTCPPFFLVESSDFEGYAKGPTKINIFGGAALSKILVTMLSLPWCPS